MWHQSVNEFKVGAFPSPAHNRIVLLHAARKPALETHVTNFELYPLITQKAIFNATYFMSHISRTLLSTYCNNLDEL
jgi:hypothetical protein